MASLLERSPIGGVELLPREEVADHRGSLTAIVIDRDLDAAPQFNIVRSRAQVLRGMHVHTEYDEYYYPSTRMFFALKDMRKNSPTFNVSTAFWSEEIECRGFRVPKGVLHGVYFAEPSVLLYGLSAPWTGAGEFGCRWNDPALGIAWPFDAPVLSERDIVAPAYAEAVEAFAAATDRG